MKDQIVLSLPFVEKKTVKKFLRKPKEIEQIVNKEIGFIFTNWAYYHWRENEGITDTKSHDEYIGRVGENHATLAIFYAAAIAYCYLHLKRVDFTLTELTRAISLAGDEDQKRLAEAFRQSQSFGAKFDKKKEKTRKT